MTLTIQDLGALGELLGSVAVLATLVYLALQTRQNTLAIGAQLDAAAIGANQTNILSAVTSSELAEALREDRTIDMTTNQWRRGAYWAAMFVAFEWQFRQARRGLLPSFDEAQVGASVGFFFTMYRSVEGWWEAGKVGFRPEFVEWVEEQRSKAAWGSSGRRGQPSRRAPSTSRNSLDRGVPNTVGRP